MKKISTAFLMGMFTLSMISQELPFLKVTDNQRYLATEDNKPFFWLGGTGWELIHRLNKEEIDIYLTDRAKKGFTVIQTVILAELEGLDTPNAYGHTPLIDNDPTKLNDDYFEIVDYVIEKSEELGLYVGLLPTWGDKFNKNWGVGPEIFTPQNAEIFGELLAKRYLSNTNIVWILGGDRMPEKENHFAIIRGMAKGIRKIDLLHLMTYHPMGGEIASNHFKDSWLDLDMFQSGHSSVGKEYKFVIESRKNTPVKPVINGESRYENIRDRFWLEEKHGWLDDADVRVSAYWSIISGAAGYTYGCNDIWQMYDIDRKPIINARSGWKTALNLPGSIQMGYMKNIFELLPWQIMQHDTSLILNENKEDESYCVAAIGNDIIVAYTPKGKPMKIDLSRMNTNKIKAYWFNPRSNKIKSIGEYDAADSHEFKPWADGHGSDFLLLVVANDSFDLSSLMK